MKSLLESRLNQVIAYKFFHNFATGMVSVFIPIFFAQQGLAIQEVFGIVLVQAAAFALIAVPVGKAVSRFGVNRSFLFSSLLYILLFASIHVFPVSIPLAVLAGVLNGMGMAFHWIPLNSEFTEGSESESRSRDYGKLEGIPSLVSPLAPLLGSLILAGAGFYTLLAVSFGIVVLSAVPLLAGGSTERPEIDLEESAVAGDRFLWVLYFVDGFASAPYTFVFPLFVYFAIGGTIETGMVKTLAGMGSGIIALGSGVITSRTGRKRSLVSGAVFSAALCLMIPLLQSSFQAFALSFFLGAGYIFYTVPLISIISDIGDGRELLGFFSIREVFQNIGRIAVTSILIAALYTLPQQLAFRVTFYLNAAALLLLASLAIWIGKEEEAIS
ncbi:MAG: MFS transporter [Candidatus Nanohaloarchaea archaeon]